MFSYGHFPIIHTIQLIQWQKNLNNKPQFIKILHGYKTIIHTQTGACLLKNWLNVSIICDCFFLVYCWFVTMPCLFQVICTFPGQNLLSHCWWCVMYMSAKQALINAPVLTESLDMTVLVSFIPFCVLLTQDHRWWHCSRFHKSKKKQNKNILWHLIVSKPMWVPQI